MPSSTDFLEGYEFPHVAKSDFQLNGHGPRWATAHPKEWGQESESFMLATTGGDRASGVICSAISADSKLLAVGSREGCIFVYDIATKELRQRLDGTGKLAFAPPTPKEKNESGQEVEHEGAPAYTLISGVSDLGSKYPGDTSKLILWELDKNGRSLDEEEPIDASALAAQAVNHITAQLVEKHEWNELFITSSHLRSDFQKALERAAADHRRRYNTVIDRASVLPYGHSPFSSDGRLMLYLDKNNEYKSPSIVVWRVKDGVEVFRLSGHTDAVMYGAFSPDDQKIATISWDGTMRMHCATTGALLWVTENSGGQSWTGAFTPDSKHMVWSADRGGLIRVHRVADGSLVSTLQKKYNDWIRCLAWHPDGQQVALNAGDVAVVWRPFDGPDGVISQHFELPRDEWRGFSGFHSVMWLGNGQKLALRSTEGSVVVWEPRTHCKELFKRPGGLKIGYTPDDFYFLAGEDPQAGGTYLSVDGDERVRYWRTPAPEEPSWWDRQAEPKPKVAYPETGKYVKLVKTAKVGGEQAEPEKSGEDKGREDWAGSGAGIWTAE